MCEPRCESFKLSFKTKCLWYYIITINTVYIGQIRRQSTWEFEIFKERWNEAISQDKSWVDPFKSDQRRIRKMHDTKRLSKLVTI